MWKPARAIGRVQLRRNTHFRFYVRSIDDLSGESHNANSENAGCIGERLYVLCSCSIRT